MANDADYNFERIAYLEWSLDLDLWRISDLSVTCKVELIFFFLNFKIFYPEC